MGKTENARDANKKAYENALKLQKDIKQDGKRARSMMSTGVKPADPKTATRRGNPADEVAARDGKAKKPNTTARPSAVNKGRNYK